ncbi:MAG TPA: hypothetical protein VJN89_20855, partial [Candidatus Acidoferrum sp.]|nr:hypothetical protein [Candidatus Acidoferrum sp.]
MTSPSAAATGSVAGPHVVERWFYIGMAIATLMTVIAGFAPSIINNAGRKAPLTPFAALHGIVSFVWLLVLLAQTTLVATRRVPLHRQLGIAAAFLAVVLVVLGYMTTVTMGRRGFDLSGDLHIDSDPLLGMVNPLGDLVPFGILLAAGYWFRHRGAVHKRLMLLATVGGLMPAPLAHLIGHYPVLNAKPAIIVIPIAMFLFASAVYDRFSLGRVHPVSLWVAAGVFVWDLLLNIVIGPSPAWHHFA